MSDAETLASLIDEHGEWGYGHGAFIRCSCGAHVGFPDDDGTRKGYRAYASHLAAVVLAHLIEAAEAEAKADPGWPYAPTIAYDASRWLARIKG